MKRFPITTFLAITFAYTWVVWFAVPLLAGNNWALGKIVTAAGFGPAVAALVLNQMHGKKSALGTPAWWGVFTVAFLVLLASYISMLITGDAISADRLAEAAAPGLSLKWLVLSTLSAAIGACICASVFTHPARFLRSLRDWRVGIRWWLVALFLPAAWMLFGVGVALVKGESPEPVSGGLASAEWLTYVFRSVVFTLLVVAVGEESGWRGWLLPALQARFSPLFSSALLGVAWGFWHFPLFVVGAYADPPEMVFAKVGACVILSIMFTWLFNRSGGNLLLMVVFHTALNNTVRFVPATEYMGIALLSVLLTMVVADKMWRNTKGETW